MRKLFAALLGPLLFAAPASASVAGWGDNREGELGAGYHSAPQNPVTTNLACQPVELHAAVAANLALCPGGVAEAWGGNGLGQLGLGDHVSRFTPTPLALSGVRQVAIGGSHSMALLSNGTVDVWGSNLFGELGNGTSTRGRERAGDNTPRPQPVPGLSGVCGIAAAPGDDVAVMCDGSVKAWGENVKRQLGAGPREVLTPRTVAGLTGVKQVAVGAFPGQGGVLVALRQDGTVLALGGGEQGQLGNGSSVDSTAPVQVKGLTGVVGVSADVSHVAALTASGGLFTWGSDQYGQLGVGSGVGRCGVFACSKTPLQVALHGVSAASAGFRYTVAISAGKPFAFGWNIRRQLGDGTTVQRSLPVPVVELAGANQVSAGWYHTLAGLTGGGPGQPIEATPGANSVTVAWKSSISSERWLVYWRAVTHPLSRFGPAVPLPGAARSYTVTGLTGLTEIAIKSRAYGVRFVTAAPSAPAAVPRRRR